MMQRRESAKPSLVRSINLRAVFDLVHDRAPIGAPGIVQATGLSRPTVADVIAQLSELELIRKVGRTSGSPGPTAQLYDVNPGAGWVLSLDVGREWLRAALTDLTGTIVARLAAPTDGSSAPELIAQLRQLTDRLCAQAGITSSYVDQVVVGVPGVILSGENHLSLAPNVPGLEAPNFTSDLRSALMAPVRFENDVNLAAVGEHVQGVARDVDDFVLVSVGSGLGMGVVLGGELHTGAHGQAGEIGYLPLTLDPARGSSASTAAGTFEALVSSDGVLELARTRGLAEAQRAVDVFEAARSGNPAARECVAIEAGRLARGIAAVNATIDAELVVLGGGIGSGAGDLLLKPVAEALAAISPLRPRLAVSALGTDAVIAGASAVGLRLALDHIFERAVDAPVRVEPGRARRPWRASA